jgi:hypothetical protein
MVATTALNKVEVTPPAAPANTEWVLGALASKNQVGTEAAALVTAAVLAPTITETAD